jgi:drug/metabolite transporter, DME family
VQAAAVGVDRSDPAYLKGVALTLFTAVAWSATGLIFRYIEEASSWQIVFFRSVMLTSVLAVVFLAQHRFGLLRAILGVGLSGLIAAGCLGIGSVFYLHAITKTTIANVAFVVSSAPFMAAALARIILHEPVARRTWLCIGIALMGVAVMVAEGFVLGGWVGILLALGSAATSAGYTIALRWGRTRDNAPVVLLAGLITMTVSAPFVGSFTISSHDLALCALQGIVISASCNVIYTVCARHVPAAELQLLSLAESVLSPLWVWLLLAEVPTQWTLVGGVIVLGAVLIQAMAAWPRTRPRAA